MPRPILIADCYLDPNDAGAPALSALLGDRPWQSVRAPYEALPSSVTPYEALIISGSAATVSPPPAWASELMGLVREARQAQVPVLGVCFGHQLLAAAIAGPAATGLAPRPEVGWTPVQILAHDPLLDGVSEVFTAFVSHGDEVHPAPPGLRVLARSSGCEVQAIRVPNAPMWGVQFHPEMPLEVCVSLVHWRAETCPELELDVPAVLADARDSSALARALFDNFLRQVDLASAERPA